MLERVQPQGIRTLIVGNNREYFSPTDVMLPLSLKDEYIQSDIDEADMDIMWHGDDKMVLLPKILDPDFVADISALFKYNNLHIFTPHESEGSLSLDILQDQQLYKLVVNSLSSFPNAKVIPWGQTPQYQEFITQLKASGAQFGTPETPEQKSLWIPYYIDTKVGSRELLTRVAHENSGVKIPEGFVCENIDSALRVAGYFLDTNRGVVFKANLGAAGVGVHIFPPDQFNRNLSNNIERISNKLRKNPLYQVGPVIVEEYIAPNFDVDSTFPSVDLVVNPDGTVEIKSINAMVIHHDNEEVGFYGCILGRGLFTQNQREKLTAMSNVIGQELVMFRI